MSYSTQQQINYYIIELKDIRGEVSNLLMPVRYFKTLNILPESLVDEEIINKNFDEEWLHKTYCETTSNCHIKYQYVLYEDYVRHFRDEVLKHSNFPIDLRVQIKIDMPDFIDDFDMYVKQINFDLSPYYMRYFEDRVLSKITEYTNKIDILTNGLTIEDLERLTKEGCKVVFRGIYNITPPEFCCVLVKVCPKTVKWKQRTYHSYYINKKNEFINDMPNNEFAIETDEGEHIVINKTNINEYI